jgi:hypothetical protein
MVPGSGTGVENVRTSPCPLSTRKAKLPVMTGGAVGSRGVGANKIIGCGRIVKPDRVASVTGTPDGVTVSPAMAEVNINAVSE